MPEQPTLTIDPETTSDVESSAPLNITFQEALAFAEAVLRVRRPLEAIPDESDDPSVAWRAESLCAQTDPEIFFPEKGGSSRDPKKICAACDVAAQCLAYALMKNERFGIWGGKSERERRRLLRQLALEQQAKQAAS